METKHKRDVYQLVTDQIIDQLEKGCVPWKRPWTDGGLPQNLITRKPYRGINVLLLASYSYSQNYFLTFRQAQGLGAKVKKGQKAHLVIFWKWDEKKDPETQEIIKVPFIRYYMVYNISQCEGIPASQVPSTELPNDPILDCEQIIHEMPQRPPLYHVVDFPYYHPEHDYVNMPPMKNFLTSESYYSTLFHELVHSTGHANRLNRMGVMQINPFNSEPYSFEELVAEIGASYLNSLTGIALKEFEQNAAYIQGWLAKLKNDKRLIITASAQAQRAADFILDVRSNEKDDAEVPEENKVPETAST